MVTSPHSPSRASAAPTPAQAATTVLIRKRHGAAFTLRGIDAEDDLVDPAPMVRGRILRSRDTSASLKSAIRRALLDMGSGVSRELVAKALHRALTDHEAKHPTA